MVVPIFREFADRQNRDQYRMLTWNGVEIEGAEDDNEGRESDGYPHTPPPRVDWQTINMDGDIVVNEHPETDSLQVARAFFNYTTESATWWRETPDENETEVLDIFTPDAISFEDAVISHLQQGTDFPLFFAVVEALRDLQAVLRSPIYHFIEKEDGGAPLCMDEAFDDLPEESKNRLTGGDDDDLFHEAVNLDLVADFLVAKRAFKGWLSATRDAKKMS